MNSMSLIFLDCFCHFKSHSGLMPSIPVNTCRYLWLHVNHFHACCLFLLTLTTSPEVSLIGDVGQPDSFCVVVGDQNDLAMFHSHRSFSEVMFVGQYQSLSLHSGWLLEAHMAMAGPIPRRSQLHLPAGGWRMFRKSGTGYPSVGRLTSLPTDTPSALAAWRWSTQRHLHKRRSQGRRATRPPRIA
jgi:hypothetical protein